MAKQFSARVTKKERVRKDISGHLDQSIFKINDEKLLKGAQLDNVRLDKIEVKKQVRTKFNDDSIKELAENIKENGLIQPLVLHREGSKYVLICGERRFRAMSTLKDMTHAPCFILENKSPEELMAIQFSENSAREQLHYIDQADSIWGYKKLTGASERKIQSSLGISKSEVHRCLLIAKLPKAIKEAAKEHNTEKYVLLEWDAITAGKAKKDILDLITSGKVRKRTELRKAISAHDAVIKTATKASKTAKNNKVASDVAANAELLLQAMQGKKSGLKMGRKEQAMLKQLMMQAQELAEQ